jgi:hypothetical protein
MRVPRTFFPAFALAVMVSASAAAETPNGSEFRVNTYTTGNQGVPQPAMDRYGRFLVVWSGEGPGDIDGVFAQRYHSSGVPAGAQFRVHAPTPYPDYLPVAGVDGKGNFVVAWTGAYSDGSYTGVMARRFSATGAPLGSEFVVNSYTTDDQYAPSLAVNEDGSFVVAWMDFQYYANTHSVRARRFDASGDPVGDDFVVNQDATVLYPFPQVRPAAGGGFVVVWMGSTDGTSYSVMGRRFDAGGGALGGEFVVNSETVYSQYTFPALASDASGRFVVSWSAYNPSTSTYDIKAQRFSAAGAFLGSEFTVNSYTTGQQFVPWVAMEPAGNFVVTWDSLGSDGSGSSVRAREFNAGGGALGMDFQVNTFAASDQSLPSVTARRPGEFLVVWQSFAQDGSSYGVYGQRLGDLIFADGFE